MSKPNLRKQRKIKKKGIEREFHWISIETGELETSLFSAIRTSLFSKFYRPSLFSWRYFKDIKDAGKVFEK